MTSNKEISLEASPIGKMGLGTLLLLEDCGLV